LNVRKPQKEAESSNQFVVFVQDDCMREVEKNNAATAFIAASRATVANGALSRWSILASWTWTTLTETIRTTIPAIFRRFARVAIA
jgi:hypothetical protein